MSSEMKLTTVSIISPPQTWNYSETSESPVPGLQHALVVDFNESDLLEFTRASRTYSLFLHHLRSVVQRDGRDNPQIDTVYLFRSFNFPDERLWKALSGLRPRFFEVRSNGVEGCIMGPLEQLRWPLEHLILMGTVGRGSDVPSNVVQYIPSLTLDYCCSLYFSPVTDHSALRHLTITQNDAIGMFNDLMKKFGVVNALQTLKLLEANYGRSHTGLAVFSKTLKQCTSLVTLELCIFERPEFGYSGNECSNGEGSEDEGSEDEDEDEGSDADWGEAVVEGDEGSQDDNLADNGSDSEDEDLQAFLRDLPHHFPQNIEHLSCFFLGPQKMVDDLSVWLQCAGNPLWVPNLKTFFFKLDFLKRTSDAEARVEKFLSLFSDSRPTVQIMR